MAAAMTMRGISAIRIAMMSDLAIIIGMPITTFLMMNITILNGRVRSVPKSAFSLE